MPRPVFTERRALTLTIVALAIATFLPTESAHWLADPPRDLVNVVAAPLTTPLKTVGDSVRRTDDLPVELGDEEQLKWAKREIERLRQQLGEADKQIADLMRVRQRVRTAGHALRRATVTAWSPKPAAPTLTLNRGSNDGVAKGQVVASGFDLVGRVVDTSAGDSTVQLITTPTTPLSVEFVAAKLDARPAGAQSRCTLEPVTSGGETVFHGRVVRDAPIRVGDLAHLADPAWPAEAAGFVVGQVTSVDPDPADPTLRRLIVVTPNQSLTTIDEVIVVVPTGEGAE